MELLKALLILLIIYLTITFIIVIIRKLLHMNMQGQSIFTNKHVNSLHKKIDWFVKGGSFLLFMSVIMMFPKLSFNAILLIILTLAALDYFVRVYFLFTYTTERKEIVVDLIELFLWVTTVVIIISLDLFQPYI